MNEKKTAALLVRNSTFTSYDLCDLNPNIFKRTTANENLHDQLEKLVDPLLSKVFF